MLAHEQLSELAERSRAGGVRLYLDMPLGVHPDSYDVWRNRDLFITGVSAGAPPDPFFTRGQNWGFPPVNPIRMRERHYAYWRKVLQTQLRYAGILRLDHVMSLHRLYLVPNGFEATEGVYIGYPAEEMYAILALESSRHQAVIVGEDLGTVPPEVRKAMDAHGVKRMFVLQFEAGDNAQEPVGIPPKNAVASLNTHDMPPFSAYWQALDADLRKDLGLLDGDGVSEARVQRKNVTTALSRMLGAKTCLDTAEARTALLDFLAQSDADMLLVNLEDLWLESEPQNTPGTSHERPNWRRRLKYSLDEMRADKSVSELLEMVEAARRKTEKVS
jgi:4-alpha-glucanotransferase